MLWLLLLCFNYSIGLILSLATMGILGICFAVAGYLPVIPWIVAVVTGHLGLAQIGRTGEGGRGQALAGLIMGYLGLALTLCTLLMYLLALVGFLTIPNLPGVIPTPPVQ